MRAFAVLLGGTVAYQAYEKQDFERRCSACWPCAGGGGAGFLQVSRGAAPEAVASVRLVEPSGRVLKDVLALRRGVADALVSLEERQRSDDAWYASILASSGALAGEMSAVAA